MVAAGEAGAATRRQRRPPFAAGQLLLRGVACGGPSGLRASRVVRASREAPSASRWTQSAWPMYAMRRCGDWRPRTNCPR